MTVYVVENVRPDFPVFANYEKAFEFAKMKADRRGGCVSVWYKNEEVYRRGAFVGDSHIQIHEREVEG